MENRIIARGYCQSGTLAVFRRCAFSPLAHKPRNRLKQRILIIINFDPSEKKSFVFRVRGHRIRSHFFPFLPFRSDVCRRTLDGSGDYGEPKLFDVSFVQNSFQFGFTQIIFRKSFHHRLKTPPPQLGFPFKFGIASIMR